MSGRMRQNGRLIRVVSLASCVALLGCGPAQGVLDDAGDSGAADPADDEPVGGELVLTPGPLDFGDVAVGCEAVELLTLANVGAGPVEVHDVSLVCATEDEPFQVDVAAIGGLPRSLEIGERIELPVRFAPMDVSVQACALVVSDTSNAPSVRVRAAATGVSAHERFDVGGGAADVLMAVDSSCSMTDDLSALRSSLADFTAALDAAGVDWQLTAVVDESGCVSTMPEVARVGDPLWVVEALFARMTTLAEDVPESEAPMAMVSAALSEWESGTCNPGLLRDNSVVHFVAVTDEDQSVPYYAAWLAEAADRVGIDRTMRLHAIARDDPGGGCARVTPEPGYYEATVASGGVFMSACEPYSGNLAALAAGIAADASPGDLTYGLAEPPIVQTVHVSVDGVEVGGWDWDSVENAVVFDAGLAPPVGAEVVVDYFPAGVCD